MLKFSVKPFFKRVAGKQFFENGCDNADHVVLLDFSINSFSKKFAVKPFIKKVITTTPPNPKQNLNK
ncbi:hypothetical protein MSBRM_2916 [Methanosarcina barkeri MS]|uniref:Uncharacterized protein n=1 Tax=Methanosarcina barkeri MS TaxID=1434108 RepID=A0A0E3QWM7_METBA|nr:hypothetical protein MSBRM_2916 [Methanosarcina barkeri MS]